MAKVDIKELIKRKIAQRRGALTPSTVSSATPPVTPVSEGIGGLAGLANKASPLIGSLLGYLAMDKLFNLPSDIGQDRLQRQTIQSQGRMATPESLYYQAALPQAQEEESQARQALMSHLSGGVLGPSLARGERLIGGR